MNIQEKYNYLKQYLKDLNSVAVAFSAGVDSTFLLKTAHDVLGDGAVAVTGCSHSYPEREFAEAKAFCEQNGIRQFFCNPNELDVEGFRQNPKNRCYLCKHKLFSQILELAEQNGIAYVAEGSNMDDNGDYRPGLMAVAELGIKSPLREAQLTKAEIRTLSKELGLPTWQKPAFACLYSRFPYGETISEEKLSMVDRAEQLLLDMGFQQMRVRIHGSNIARIEVLPQEMDRLMQQDTRERITAALKSYGFTYVTLDLQGYRMGSMNETL